MNAAKCPPQDEIAAYILGTVEDNKMEAVGDHLSDCPRCQALADELESSASDPVTDLLHVPKPPNDFSGELECQQALPKAKKIGELLFGSCPPDTEGIGDDELALPAQLGEYRLLERIGGHMGIVYKASHTTMDRFVAVKVLPARALADGQAIIRFQQEMKAVGRLEHPNIVRAYDAREIEGKHVLVMELVEGRNLSDVAHSHGPLMPADACEVARQAAVGLQYAHEKGLVHRDIKPSNLMLTRDGQVKILDLGLARFHTLQPAAEEMTGAGNTVGTAHYMAPEQVTGSHTVDIRADIYSLGCTLYRLLCGRVPFDDPKHERTADVLTAHLREPVPSITKICPEIPNELAAIVDRMLAKSPSDRFETPGQVAAAMEPFTAGCDLRALAVSWENRRRSDVRPVPPTDARPFPWFWTLLATAAAVSLLVVGGKMAYQGLDHFWASGGAPLLARNQQQSPDKPRPTEQPAPAENSKNEPKPKPSKTAGSQGAPVLGGKSAKVPSGQVPKNPQEQTPRTAASASNPSIPQSPTSSGNVAPTETPRTDPDWLRAAGNKRAEFLVSIEVDHADHIYRGPPDGPDGKGEVMHVKVKSSKSGYLYLIYQSADGELSCLFPNRVQQDNKISADTDIVVPHPDAKFRLRVGPPYGKELLKAVVSLAPRKPEDFGVRSFTEGDVTPLQSAALKSVFVELEKDPANWAEHQVQITTMAGKASSTPRRAQNERQNADPPSAQPSGEGLQKTSPRPSGEGQGEVQVTRR